MISLINSSCKRLCCTTNMVLKRTSGQITGD